MAMSFFYRSNFWHVAGASEITIRNDSSWSKKLQRTYLKKAYDNVGDICGIYTGGRFRENLIVHGQYTSMVMWSLTSAKFFRMQVQIMTHIIVITCSTFTFRFNLIDFQLHTDFPFKICVFYHRNHLGNTILHIYRFLKKMCLEQSKGPVAFFIADL